MRPPPAVVSHSHGEALLSLDFGASAPGTATVQPLDGGSPRGSFPVEIFASGTPPPPPLGRFHLEDEGVFQLCFQDEFVTEHGHFNVGGCWSFR